MDDEHEHTANGQGGSLRDESRVEPPAVDSSRMDSVRVTPTDLTGTNRVRSSASRSVTHLLARAREGSRSALGQLMESCRPWLRAMARRQLPKDLSRKQDASDAVQDCQLHATAQFAQFKGQSGAEFFAWMRGILTRRVFRTLRYWGKNAGIENGRGPCLRRRKQRSSPT